MMMTVNQDFEQCISLLIVAFAVPKLDILSKTI